MSVRAVHPYRWVCDSCGVVEMVFSQICDPPEGWVIRMNGKRWNQHYCAKCAADYDVRPEDAE